MFQVNIFKDYRAQSGSSDFLKYDVWSLSTTSKKVELTSIEEYPKAIKSCFRTFSTLYPICKWAASWQNQQSEYAPSEDSDQTGRIRGFAVRMKKAWTLSYPLSAQRRLWSAWADGRTAALLILSRGGSNSFMKQFWQYCTACYSTHICFVLALDLSVFSTTTEIYNKMSLLYLF